jgi:hypothetical protein
MTVAAGISAHGIGRFGTTLAFGCFSDLVGEASASSEGGIFGPC